MAQRPLFRLDLVREELESMAMLRLTVPLNAAQRAVYDQLCETEKQLLGAQARSSHPSSLQRRQVSQALLPLSLI